MAAPSHASALAHRAFARIAFVVETALMAVAASLLLSFMIVRSDWLATAHEWGLFWTHYANANDEARAPVNAVLLGVLGALFVAIGACRLRAAQLVWNHRDHGGQL